MPEMKRNFTKGKMNKDLDERLVPNGEYRDAMNIQVSTSEGSDVGTIQNVLGNTPGCVYSDPLVPNPILAGSATVGSVSDEKNDSLYWLVAGPSDDGANLSLALGDTVSFKDIIMRTNALNNTGCEPVFVDKYGWCIGVDPAGGLMQNSITIDPTEMSNVTAGMNVTGYNNGVGVFDPTLVTSVGPLSTLAPISYYQAYTTQFTPPITSNPIDLYLRTFEDPNNSGQFSQIHDNGVVNGATSLPGLDGNNQVQTNIIQLISPTYLEPEFQVGAIVNAGVFFDSGVIIDITYNSICPVGTDVGCACGTCTLQYIVTIDVSGAGFFDPGFPNPAIPPFGPPNWDGEMAAFDQILGVTAKFDPADIFTPNNIIHILPGGSQWLDEVYNILWDAQGNPTLAELVIDSNFWGGVNFPPDTCIDPNSVTGINDSQYELIGCSWGNNPGQTVNALNLNPHNSPISFNVYHGSVEAIFLNDSVDLNFSDTLCFTSERVLEFNPNNLITGINIIDDMLFWTDNFTEPKKISIPRSITGTEPLGDTHTAIVNNATGLSLANYTPIRKEHITVIRKTPKNALNLELSTGRDPDLNYSGITYTAVDPSNNLGINASSIITSSNNTVISDFSTLVVGDKVQFEIETDYGNPGSEDFELAWEMGDIILLKEFDVDTLGFATPPPIPLANHTIRGVITTWQYTSFVNDTSLQTPGILYGSEWPASAAGTAHVEIEVVSLNGTPPEADPNNLNNPVSLNYVVDLEIESDPIFEDKFPRFSYRYKYADGEYSTFAPWSEVAFSPSHFNYEAKKGWNTGMINHLVSVKFKGFVPTVWGQPLGQDVIEVDILYKEEGSPNIYVVETISPLDIIPVGATNPWYAGNGTGEYEITSEIIRHILPSNQLLRSWDNVPKKALAQDISGNRIVYANYEQNFDLTVSGLKFKPEFKNHLSTWNNIAPGEVQKSIKSLRDYKLGVVFTDEYGRETPILISKSGGFKVEKKYSENANRLVAGLGGNAPASMAYFKFFIKETSTEYYNLAMDRWYAAEDGNIWLAFPSNDRNKVDLETSLYFKKGDDAVENTTKYKILAIENEAPEFIKTRRIRIGSVKHNVASSNRLFGNGVGAGELASAPSLDEVSFTLDYSAGFQGSSISKMEDITEDIYIQFVSSNDYSSQYKVSEITSDRDAQNQLSVDANMGGQLSPPTQYYVTLDTSLKDDINFIFDNAANPSLIEDDVTLKFTKAVVENKPIYDGRFFAKIENDGKIKNQITDDSIGVNYHTRVKRTIYLLENDEDLKVRSSQAALADLLHPVGGNSSYTNLNAITQNYTLTVYPGYNIGDPSPNGNQNINGENINNWFARSSYFNDLPPVGYTAIDRFGDFARYSSSGVWFIDTSTYKHTSYSGDDGDVTNLYWPDNNNMNHTSPGYPNGNNNPADSGWTTTNFTGPGITNASTYSSMRLSFGGLGFRSGDGIAMLSGNNDVDPTQYSGLFEDFFSVGVPDVGWGNTFGPGTVKFVNRLNAGFMFKWDEDPTGTIYTFINQRNITNRIRFSRHDYPVAHDGLHHRNDMMNSYASYHRSWDNQIEPAMDGWDPAGLIGTFMTNGLELRDIVIKSHDISTSANSVGYPGSYDLTINTIVVDTTKSICYNGNSPSFTVPGTGELHSLHKGMMLTAYDVTAVNTPGVPPTGAIAPALMNMIVKKVGLFDQNLDGGNGGYEITLTGYHQPLHWDSTTPETGDITDGRNLVFKQVTMNGASRFTEQNTDQYKQYWENDDGSDGSGGIGAVGYTMKMVEPIDEYSDGGNLPPNPYVWETEPKDNTGLDIYYEISENNAITLNPSTIISAIPIGSKVENTSGLGHGWGDVTVSNNISATGDTIDLSTTGSPAGVYIGPGPFVFGNLILQPLTVGDNLKITKPNGIQFDVRVAGIIPDGANPQISTKIILDTSIYNSKYHLNWHNCFSFGNGVESNRIKDNFNLPYIANGIKASTTLDREYKQERRKHGLIYSGLYNSTSGVNNLNQFIAAEKITKDINPIYGSIQKLKAGWGQLGDLIAFCEDRVLKILADKDALYNADGNTNVTATNRVLGTATPYSGEYGISTNPESFASESYRAYFTDKVRGTVMRLSKDGLTPISAAGMKDWFRDNLKLNNKLVGSFDDKKDEYNISLTNTTEGVSKSVTFKEDVKGWVSFKSFVTKNGISCANEYYTFKDANLWRHHHDVPGNRNTFYGIFNSNAYSTFNVLLNDAPGIVKSFNTLNYEGSKSKITQFTTDPTTGLTDGQYYNLTSTTPGWYVDSISTNKESGHMAEFIEKEGKWFNYLKGKDIPHGQYDNIIVDGNGDSLWDQASFAIQGLGVAQNIFIPTVLGCTDDGTNPNFPGRPAYFTIGPALNYNPLATVDDGSCTYPPPIDGCLGQDDGNGILQLAVSANNYDCAAGNINYPCSDNVNQDDGSCIWSGCTDPTALYPTLFPLEAQIYVGGAGAGIIDDGSCTYPVPGCMDSNIGSNPDILGGCLNNTNVGYPNVGGCGGNNGYYALDFNPAATVDDGSCTYPVYGCLGQNDANGNFVPAFHANNYDPSATQDDGSCFWDYCVGHSTDLNYPSLLGNTTIPQMQAEAQPHYIFSGGYANWTNCVSGGCTDSSALNYNPAALYDDGNCTYPTYGCTCGGNALNGAGVVNDCYNDGNAAFNYDPLATNDDGSCVECVWGCTDSSAQNYDPTATCDDGSCIPFVFGCMDPAGMNYNPTVTTDDGACVYPGCTDPAACNTSYFNHPNPGNLYVNPILASFDDGSCCFGICGCMDASAINYNANATCDDGSCILACPDYAAHSPNIMNASPYQGHDGIFSVFFGPPNPPGTFPAAQYYTVTVTDASGVSGIGSAQFGYGVYVNNNGHYKHHDIPGTSPIPSNYTIEIVDNLGCPIFGPYSFDVYINNAWPGCMDPSALNYESNATYDDGSCIY